MPNMRMTKLPPREQAPDVRVALDLAENGGFLITFRP